MKFNRSIFFYFLTSISILQGCSVNPVTGKYDFDLISESEEISIGRENYSPQRQLQRGDYIVDPKLTDYIVNIGNKLVKVSDKWLPYEFTIVNSSDFNAWALPGGKIGINRGLLVHLKCESELAAILAHEIVHAAASHGANGKSRGLLLDTIRDASSLVVHDAEKLRWIQNTVDIGGKLILMKYSRDHELEADFYGMKYMQRAGFYTGGMVTVQETMAKLSNNKSNSLFDIMFSTHPPSRDRIDQSRALLAKSPSVRDTTECSRYQKATQHLKKTAIAYDYYEKSSLSFKYGKLSEASKLIKKAISIEPRESLFWGVQAQIHKKNNRKKQALTAINKAINLNPNYWKHYLIRGSLQEKLGNSHYAVDDLKKSNRLLPTVEAYYSLGRLSLANNQQEQAVNYFLNAWTPNSQLGTEAGKMLASLDMDKNPSRYLAASIYLENANDIIVNIQNKVGVPAEIQEIMLIKGMPWDNKKYQAYIIDEIIYSGEELNILLSDESINKEKLYKYQVQVIKARVVK